MKLKKLKTLLLSVLLSLSLSVGGPTFAQQKAAVDRSEDFKFAATPFEYASLPSPTIQPNIIFLIDNSFYASPWQAQNIVMNFLSYPDIIGQARVGIAYLYADTHPFISAEINLRFWACLAKKTIAILPPQDVAKIVEIISEAIAAGGPTGGAGIVPVIIAHLPDIIAIISRDLPQIIANILTLTDCLKELNNHDRSIYLNTQKPVKEVKINSLLINGPEVLASLLTSSTTSPFTNFGLPVLVRRYYEISREIRGLPQHNSFLERYTDSGKEGGDSPLGPDIPGIPDIPDIPPIPPNGGNDNGSNDTPVYNAFSTYPPASSSTQKPQTRGLLNTSDDLLSGDDNGGLTPGIPDIPNIPTGPTDVITPDAEQIGKMIDLLVEMIYNASKVPPLSFLIGPIPRYEPLFTETMQYRCQPTTVVILSPSVPARHIGGNLILTLRDVLNKLVAPVVGVNDFTPYLPIPDYNPVDVPEDDSLVREAIFQPGEGQSITFQDWQNEEIQYGEYGLAFLTQLFEHSDLKHEGSDREGKSWDEGDYPIQNIKTIGIRISLQGLRPVLGMIWLLFGEPVSTRRPDIAYLLNAVSPFPRIGGPGFIERESNEQAAKELHETLKKSLLAVNTENISGAPSTVLAALDPVSGVSAYLNTGTWSSTLRFYKLNASNQDFVADLSNYSTPDFQGARPLIVSTGSEAPKLLKGDSALNTWLLRPAGMSDQAINAQYRSHLRERCSGNNATCNERMIGDILNTPILSIDDDPTIRNRVEDPHPNFVVAAANDGMVHVFKKSGDNQSYSLALDYLPGAAKRGNSTLWAQVKNLAHPAYGHHAYHPHQFFINGGLSYLGTMKKECQADGKDYLCKSKPAQLFMVGSYGQGGKGLYALNLGGKDFQNGTPIALSRSNGGQLPKEIPLWESGSKHYGANKTDGDTQKANDALGYIMGSPIIASVAIERVQNNEFNQMLPKNEGDIRYAVFTGNGFFNNDPDAALYVFDTLGVSRHEKIEANGKREVSYEVKSENQGKLIGKISTGTPKGKNDRQGLSAPAVIDSDDDGIADIAYAGDYKGNLYRFDLRKKNPKDWTATKIYSATKGDQKQPDQPITTAPTVYRLDGTGHKYVVMFGTGSDLFQDDLLQPARLFLHTPEQAIYGIYDDLNDPKPQTVSRADLLEQTIQPDGHALYKDRHSTITLSDHKMTPQYRGWFIRLTNGPGERVVRPGKVTGNSVFFTTRIYRSKLGKAVIYGPNQCVNQIANGSTGYLIGINPRNGGRLKRMIMNLNPIQDRYKETTQFISGFKFFGVPSELSFVSLAEKGTTDRSGQFVSGWEDPGLYKLHHYDEGSLVVTSTEGDYYVISVREPNFIRVRKLSAREVL